MVTKKRCIRIDDRVYAFWVSEARRTRQSVARWLTEQTGCLNMVPERPATVHAVRAGEVFRQVVERTVDPAPIVPEEPEVPVVDEMDDYLSEEVLKERYRKMKRG